MKHAACGLTVIGVRSGAGSGVGEAAKGWGGCGSAALGTTLCEGERVCVRMCVCGCVPTRRTCAPEAPSRERSDWRCAASRAWRDWRVMSGRHADARERSGCREGPPDGGRSNRARRNVPGTVVLVVEDGRIRDIVIFAFVYYSSFFEIFIIFRVAFFVFEEIFDPAPVHPRSALFYCITFAVFPRSAPKVHIFVPCVYTKIPITVRLILISFAHIHCARGESGAESMAER